MNHQIFQKMIEKYMASKISTFFERRRQFKNNKRDFRKGLITSLGIVAFVASVDDVFQNSAGLSKTFV